MDEKITLKDGRIRSLEALRFIMMVWIVVDHSYASFFGSNNDYYFLKNGPLAVDFFFVLSGFGMMLSNIRKNQKNESNDISVKSSVLYAIAHQRKLYPIFLFSSVVIFLLRILCGRHEFQFFPDVLFALFNLSLTQSLTGTRMCLDFMYGAAWFLSSLFVIQLFCPRLMCFLRNLCRNEKKIWIGLSVSFVGMVLAGYLLFLFQITFETDVWGVHIFDKVVYVSPLRRVFQVAMGMLIAMLVSKKNLCYKNPTILEFASVALFLLYAFFRPLFGGFYKAVDYLCVDTIVIAILLFVFSLNSGLISEVFSIRLFQKLGKLSMYVYLIHQVFIEFPWNYCFERFFSMDSNDSLIFALLRIFLIFACSWGGAMLMNVFFERFQLGKK